MLTKDRLKDAKDLYYHLKIRLHFTNNIYMVKYYNKFIYRLEKLIKKYEYV